MLSAFLNVRLTSESSVVVLQIEEKLEQKVEVDIVLDSNCMNNLIAGLFG